MNHWYVVITKHGMEFFAAANLRDQQFNVFLPTLRESVVKNKKRVTVVRPLYSGYLFIELDIDKHRWRSVNGTRGVVGLISSAPELPSRIPDGFVEELSKTADSDGVVAVSVAEMTAEKFLKGQTVVVNTSVFNGLAGKVVSTDRSRVCVLLSLLSTEIRVMIAPAHLEHSPDVRQLS